MAEMTDLKQPIAIRTEYITAHPTTIHIKQNKTPKHDSSEEDLTVWRSSSSEKSNDEQKLFSVTSESVPFSQRRHFRNASGLPLFELWQKKAGVTWFVHLPGGNETVSSESIAAIAPRWNPFKNKLDVYVINAAGVGDEVKLKVRGQDLSRSRTHVYCNGALVMAATRTSGHESVDENEWKVDLAGGMDISLASVIMVVMAYMLHITAASLYRGCGDTR
ncbi:tubby C-terminal-like domain-containing protein [Aspergillus keveii]|uniref:Tubby C-terminal-like domain-containing protein n=1 Tax=Aspergillus keveii TaxID=714993 RepID=A0ABR4GB24_9EURO